MTSKNPVARHKRFLSAGFFAPEIPRCFYSETLSKCRTSLIDQSNKLTKKKGEPDYYFYRSQKSTFRFPRFQNADRIHSIISPIAYFFLSRVLADNYLVLKSINRKSKISASPSIFDWSGERTLKRPSFDARDAYLSDVNARFEYLVSTDISAFYHSIYTHSIAWAVHGKKVAKKDTSSSLVGNLIDRLSRNSQDGQTIGLPVGPDTSRLIAEVVGSAIDRELQKKIAIPKGRAFRFVDDFTLGCNDSGEAEKALALVRRAVNFFELELNSQKTSIASSIATPAGGWKTLMRSQVPIAPYSDDQMKIFMFRVAELAKQLPEINIERFSLQNARRAFVEAPNWSFLENYLIALYKKNSTVVDIVVELFVLRHQAKHDVSLATVASFIESRLPILCDQQRNGEASWLLSMAIALEIKIRSQCLQCFFGEEDPFTAVLISDANKKGLIRGRIDRTVWNKHLNTEGLDGEMWLYVYESVVKDFNGTANSDRFLKAHRYFSILLDKKVEFYRSGQGITNIRNVLQRRKMENLATLRLVADFDDDHEFNIEEIDDFDFLDDDDTY